LLFTTSPPHLRAFWGGSIRLRGAVPGFACAPAPAYSAVGDAAARSAAKVVGVFVMTRVIAVVAWGVPLAACSGSSLSLNFLRSAPSSEALRIESEPPGAEAKTSLGPSCRTPCELVVQSAGEFSVTLTLAGFRSQTISVRPEMPAAADRDSETPA